MADVTARDLAKMLGISTAAVSMALNGKPGVSSDTRQKVLATAAKLNYVTPKSRHTERQAKHIISFVIYTGIGVAEQTTFSTFVLRGAEAAAKSLGYRVLVHYFYADQPWDEQIKRILSDACGVILLGTDITEPQRDAFFEFYHLGSVPLVIIDNFLFSAYVDCVGNDNTYGVKSAVSYLIKCGHRSIGYLRSKQRIVNFDDRELGIKLSMEEHADLGLAPLQVLDVDISPDKAREDILGWLAGGNTPAGAYFCENDMLAAAFIRSLKESGYRVPEDVSVMGFDDVQICEMIEPPITTMHAFKERLGKTAMELLSSRIEAGDTLMTSRESGLMKVALSLQIKERMSVRCVE
ncbi:MAG: LacI family DNA-binding transcriptional regulator [Eubacteriales bacterium]|nr:LacI family DNA-binding transcriptional regulator [Eubacteriales bacterium]